MHISRKRLVLFGATLIALLGTAYAVSVYYRTRIDYSSRQYIHPRDVQLNFAIEIGYNTTGGVKDFGDIGNAKTWGDAKDFVATFINTEEVDDSFNTFTIELNIFGTAKNLTLTSPTQTWNIEASQSGDVLVKVFYDAKDIQEFSGTGTVIWEIKEPI